MDGESNNSHRMGGRGRTRHPDALIGELARDQYGVVARRQLLEAGLSRRQIERRVSLGTLHPRFAGVYAVGHPVLRVEGHRLAAVLAGGPEAFASHRMAGAIWSLISWNGRPSVTVPSWRPSTGQIAFHTRSLPADEITALEGIPVTTVPRTLLDLATVLDRHRLLNAINEAEERGLGDPLSLPALIERHRGERGVAILRTVLADAGYGVPKRELEERFQQWIADRGLPRPMLNAWVQVGSQHFSPDCLWRTERVIVELHSARHHSTQPKVNRDARRDRLLALAGWLVIHVTWAQLHDSRDADELDKDLRIALGL